MMKVWELMMNLKPKRKKWGKMSALVSALKAMRVEHKVEPAC